MTNYIFGIKVVYGDQQTEQPGDRIRERNGGSDNINHGFGGKFVWLVPEYASVTKLAITGFAIVIQKECDPSRDDLAKGAGGDYRYLLLENNVREPEKVTEVALLRRQGKTGDNSEWNTTSNINEGRGGDELYLLWKTSSSA